MGRRRKNLYSDKNYFDTNDDWNEHQVPVPTDNLDDMDGHDYDEIFENLHSPELFDDDEED